ncbi:MAG: glycosyltransferase [Bacilli bacterium]
MDKSVVIISGINLIDAGPLSVFTDFLDEIIKSNYYSLSRFIILVGNKELFKKYNDYFEIVEFKKSKKNWLFRLYYEYFYFYFYSLKLKPEIWISMHDVTPNVRAKKRYVYCHNATPFSSMKLSEIKFGLKYYLFSKFYKYLYAINIKKNTYVIVQQDWLRKMFNEMFKIDNIIVARPSYNSNSKVLKNMNNNSSKEKKSYLSFVFPSYPRYFKNFQLVCEASKILDSMHVKGYKLFLTFDGNENNYSKMLVKKYKNCENIVFCGFLSRDELVKLYEVSDCLIFMSKLESWGMPITEYKTTNKIILVPKLPYAYETVGSYKNVKFLDSSNSIELSKVMKDIIDGVFVPETNVEYTVAEPYAANWKSLCDFIFAVK